MVQTRDITRLPNCYQESFIKRVTKKTLQVKHIDYQLASIHVVSLTKTRYKALPEAYYCQGIVEYTHHGQHIRNVFIYHIGWASHVPRQLRVKSALYPFNRIGS